MSGSNPATTLSRMVATPLARMLWRPRIIGRKNIPKHGALILASNHRSFIDSLAIGLMAPRRVSFLAKKEYFTGTGFKGGVSRAFFGGIGAIGVERGAGSAAQEALDLGLERLQAGEAFAIYPEGTRSIDGRLYRGRTGVAWLALTSGAPVVPVALRGTEDVQPVGSRFPKLARVSIEFGKPMDLSSFGEASSGRARRHATDAVMAAIQELSGQELANSYNNPPSTIVERVRQVLRRDDPTDAVEPD